MADSSDDKPSRIQLHVEPPIPVTTEFTNVEHVRGIVQELDQGQFRRPALLVERMLMNPRLRAVVETRLAGLIATEIRWEPAKNNKAGRRAAEEIEQDWPIIAPAPMRKQMLKWALFLGFGLGQRVPDEAPGSGRAVYKLRPYWPGFASWYWARKAYRIITFDAGMTEAATPSVDRKIAERYAISPILDGAPSAAESPWIISEPFGVNSYRDGLVHAAWRPWLGHDWAMRDQARASQKHGLGIFKAIIPRGTGDQYKAAVAAYTNGLRNMGSEGVIPCEEDSENDRKFDVETVEFSGSGFQAISDTMGANAVALAILFLGHNLTTEIKGGGSYAAAGVADYIRDDKKYDDSATEQDYAGPQLIRPWAEANYGDPELAPRARYVTDSPAVNRQRAQRPNYVGQAAAQLRANIPDVDLRRLAEEFRLPMLDPADVVVQVPEAIAPSTSPVPSPKSEPPVPPTEKESK
jgi:hypothetical protein